MYALLVSMLHICPVRSFRFNVGCNFSNWIHFFFSFVLGLIGFVLYYIDLVASYCVVRGSKKFFFCVCVFVARERET